MINQVCRFVTKKRPVRLLSTNSDDVFDIIVVGGGVVGSLLVSKLLTILPVNDGIKLALVEGSDTKPLNTVINSPLPDIRNFALSPSSIRSLESVGAWQLIKSRTREFDKMQVWNENGSGYINFAASDSGNRILGAVAESSCLTSALVHRILALNETGNRLSMFTQSKITGASISAGLSSLSLSSMNGKSNHTISGRLIIAADGAQSIIRQQAGIPTYGWSYCHQPIVGIVKLASSSPSCAFQIMTKLGPLALLPLYDDYASFIWSIPLANHPSDVLSSISSLLKTLPRPSPIALPIDFLQPPIISSLSSSFVFPTPLVYSSARSYVKGNIALIGDSAHSIHPMAGQGLNLGIADAESLAKYLLQAMRNGMDLTCFLSNYDQERRKRNGIMMAGIDGLYRLYGYDGNYDNNALSSIRNVGMSVLNSVSFIKAQVAKYAIGLADDDEGEHKLNQ